jgi:SAM-dependent methyltransferase
MAIESTAKGNRHLRTEFPWVTFVKRFQEGTWRSPIFRDMVLHDMEQIGPAPRVLDIGCGRGFDDSPEIQAELASRAGRYIGIEPDTDVAPPASCQEFHATVLEKAPIEVGSIDVAFAVFVIEHLDQPEAFFDAIHRILAPGGVFWGFTIDARSPFAFISKAMKAARIKDRYLDHMFGRGDERHRNYPTLYAANTPPRVKQLTSRFSSCEVVSLHHVGIIDGVLPRPLRPLSHALDQVTIKRGWPGTNLAIRLIK